MSERRPLSAREKKEFLALRPNDAARAIELRCEQLEMSRAELEVFIGPRGRVTEVLNGKRGLSKSMIRRLYLGLGIPLEHLLEIAK